MRIVPYITCREGETPAPHSSLRGVYGPDGRLRLGYRTELPDDRDLNGVLWARCSQQVGSNGLPIGKPQWKLVHPARQRDCMQRLLCQICAQPARTPQGFIFLTSPGELPPGATTLHTTQPPVCPRHTRTATTLCPALAGTPNILLVPTPRLHGVLGTPYGYGPNGIQPTPHTADFLPYGHPGLPWYLASQMVRRLQDFQIVPLEKLAQRESESPSP